MTMERRWGDGRKMSDAMLRLTMVAVRKIAPTSVTMASQPCRSELLPADLRLVQVRTWLPDRLLSSLAAGRPNLAWLTAVPILVVLVLVARNDNWIFTRTGWLDPWLYVGFHYHYVTAVFQLDIRTAPHLGVPFGASIMLLARKPSRAPSSEGRRAETCH